MKNVKNENGITIIALTMILILIAFIAGLTIEAVNQKSASNVLKKEESATNETKERAENVEETTSSIENSLREDWGL